MVQRGEVYYIVDQDYNNVTKNYAVTKDARGRVIKDNTIKGNRPWTIIGVNGRTVTVLPLTTKQPHDKNLYHKVYDLKHNKTSYVLLTQPKTVNISELGDFVFKIKSKTVNSIIDMMSDNLKGINGRDRTTHPTLESSTAKEEQQPHRRRWSSHLKHDEDNKTLIDYVLESSLNEYIPEEENTFTRWSSYRGR